MPKFAGAHIPHLKITTPKRTHLVLAVLCLLGCVVGALKFGAGDGRDFELANDGLIFGALTLGFVVFAWRAAKPVARLEFAPRGVWTQAAGWQPWEMVDELLVETRSGYKGIQEKCLLLHWNEEVDLPPQQLVELYKFSDLSISEARFSEQMAAVLQAFRA